MDNNIATLYCSQKGREPLTYNDRISALEALESEIKRRENDIVDALRDDLGKSRFEAITAEVDFCLHEIKLFKKKLKKWMKPKRVSTPLSLMPATSYIKPEPYGQVLIIAPWNYPFQLALLPLIGAIGAGNSVILKPSEMAPKTSGILSEIVTASLDSEIAAVIEGGVEETTELLELKFDYIFYTGNGHVGRIVMKAAAKNLTPVTLELGGKSPAIILTKNLDLAAKRIAWGKFYNAGQTCVAPDYILMRESDIAPFIDASKRYLEEFYTKTIKTSPDYGRIINERHFDRIHKLIEIDKVLTGAEVDKGKKYIAPTYVRATFDSAIMKEEIFGPVLPIISIDNLEEAIAHIKQHDKPLACYPFVDSSKDKDRVVEQISCGGMVINDTIVHLVNNKLPFGGVGESGMGSYQGKFSFDIFSHQKSVMKRSYWLEVDLRYPPYKGKLSLVRKIFSWFS